MAALGSQVSGVQEESHASVPPGSCPVCSMIAEAVVRWPPEQSRLELWLGEWKDFLERRQCECCQAIVQYMNSSIIFQKYGPQCSLILDGVDGRISIRNVRFRTPRTPCISGKLILIGQRRSMRAGGCKTSPLSFPIAIAGLEA
jgi:hypothetical protein